MKNLKIVYLTNPNYLQTYLWPLIVKFADRVKLPGLSPHSIMTYLLYGLNSNELEVPIIVDDGNNEVLGFAVFQILGPPFFSTGLFRWIYVDKKAKSVTDDLFKEFVHFLERHKLIYCQFATQIDKLGKYFKKKANEIGLITTKKSFVYIGRRKIQGE